MKFSEFMKNRFLTKESRDPDQSSLPIVASADPLTTENIRKEILEVVNLISNFEPSDIEDCKDLLIKLKEEIENKLGG
jgi:hypothetical protein